MPLKSILEPLGASQSHSHIQYITGQHRKRPWQPLRGSTTGETIPAVTWDMLKRKAAQAGCLGGSSYLYLSQSFDSTTTGNNMINMINHIFNHLSSIIIGIIWKIKYYHMNKFAISEIRAAPANTTGTVNT